MTHHISTTSSHNLYDSLPILKAASGEAGLKFTVDFGMGMFNALNTGDIINEMIYRIRPYEVNKGDTDRAFTEGVDRLCDTLRDGEPYEILESTPKWISSRLAERKK